MNKSFLSKAEEWIKLPAEKNANFSISGRILAFASWLDQEQTKCPRCLKGVEHTHCGLCDSWEHRPADCLKKLQEKKIEQLDRNNFGEPYGLANRMIEPYRGREVDEIIIKKLKEVIDHINSK